MNPCSWPFKLQTIASHLFNAKMTGVNFEGFQNMITKLSNDENNRKQLLSELKLTISTLNVPQLKLITLNLQLDAIFDCLNSSES